MKEEGEEERVKEKGEKYNNHHNKQKTRESERKKEVKREERQSLPPLLLQASVWPSMSPPTGKSIPIASDLDGLTSPAVFVTLWEFQLRTEGWALFLTRANSFYGNAK